MRLKFAATALALAAACFAQTATPQSAARPLRIIVPFVTGGAVDGSARTLGAQITETSGQAVVVENRPGGSSIIGMQACAKSPPDGGTVCLTTADSLSYNPFLFRNLPYDAEKDFAPVMNVARGVSMVFARGNAPFNSYREMLDHAKSKPGSLNWGTWGLASVPDVYLQWTRHAKGVDIAAVPYKGSGQAVPATLAGEVDISFMTIGAVLPNIRAGKLKPLAVVGTQRSPLLPEVPSLGEEGADPGLRSYFGLFAAAGTPKAAVDRLNAEFAKAVQSQRVKDFFSKLTLEVVGGTADEFAQFLREERANTERVFRAIGVRPTDAPS